MKEKIYNNDCVNDFELSEKQIGEKKDISRKASLNCDVDKSTKKFTKTSKFCGIKRFTSNFIFGAYFSALITFLFAFYNMFLGIFYLNSWNISMFVYYLCLTIARFAVIIIESKIKNCPTKILFDKQKKACIGLSIFMCFIDLCLLAPITLILISPNEYEFGIIPAIIIAVYTTYKIIIAIKNYIKQRRSQKLTFKFLKALSIVDGLVSILTLQNTLIMVNGGMKFEMKILSAISSFVIVLIIVIFSVIQLVNAIKVKQWG